MAKPTGLSDEVRTIFEARKGQSLGHQQVFELMDVTGVDKTKERNGVRDVLTWLVSCGYLVKTGARATAAYRYSGQGMRFHKATAEELRERRIERARPRLPCAQRWTAEGTARGQDDNQPLASRAAVGSGPCEGLGQGEGRPEGGRNGGGVRGTRRAGAAPDGQLGAASMTAPALKPCPFCGAPGRMLGSADKGWHVWCTGDEEACSPSPMTHIAWSPSAAAEYWNKRSAGAVGWRPIADAPQDGTRLMLWDSVSKRPVFGSWRGHNPAITHFAAEPAGPEVA